MLRRADDDRPGRQVVPPIAAFVAAGFEHSVANIYFIPMGLFIKAGAPTPSGHRSARRRPISRRSPGPNFLVGNLLPVTLGNIIGGSLMVAAVYWFVYLRKEGGLRHRFAASASRAPFAAVTQPAAPAPAARTADAPSFLRLALSSATLQGRAAEARGVARNAARGPPGLARETRPGLERLLEEARLMRQAVGP